MCHHLHPFTFLMKSFSQVLLSTSENLNYIQRYKYVGNKKPKTFPGPLPMPLPSRMYDVRGMGSFPKWILNQIKFISSYGNQSLPSLLTNGYHRSFNHRPCIERSERIERKGFRSCTSIAFPTLLSAACMCVFPHAFTSGRRISNLRTRSIGWYWASLSAGPSFKRSRIAKRVDGLL